MAIHPAGGGWTGFATGSGPVTPNPTTVTQASSAARASRPAILITGKKDGHREPRGPRSAEGEPPATSTIRMSSSGS